MKQLQLLIPAFALLLFSCIRQDKTATIVNETNPDHPYNYVDPFIGTGGEGHTYPGATVPFGMVQLGPDTDVKYFKQSFPWCTGYQYGDSSIIGFSHTHFSGTGHSDLGDVLIMPTVGTLKLEPGSKENPDEGFRSRFSHTNETSQPGYYQVLLSDYNINAELTTTERAGFHKYTFPQADSAHIILDLVSSIYNYNDKVLWSEIRVENDTLVTGYRQTNGWAANRHIYFAIRFSKPFESYGMKKFKMPEYGGFGKRDQVLENYPDMSGKNLVAWFNFATQEKEEILLKVGISSVSMKNALKNLDTEIVNWDFEQTKQAAREKWLTELDVINIEGTTTEKENFYTALYHTMLAPTLFMDVDGLYRGPDMAIHKAEGYTNYSLFSLWDTYRATHPLFTITKPERDGDMISSMVQFADQNVHKILPIWAFHGQETWCMIGYHAVPVIADAWLKGIDNFDVVYAFEAMNRSATYGPYDGLEAYMNYGFVPIDLENEGASKTLEYAYDDWTIAQMAKSIGREVEFEYYSKRALNYQNVFDKETLFMRARKSDSTFRKPFDPLYAQYGGDYTEGNAWQYSWYVPHDVQGLINLMGGKEVFLKRLDSLFVIEGDEDQFKHVEDIAGLIGQYAHGNEPSHHIAYLYNYAGESWKTQFRIHQIMKNLFNNTPYGIPGNEDCGQMSAWYIFSSLGFYPVCPGSNEYVIGSPCIPKATIKLSNGKNFTMEAQNLTEANIYIQSATLNGEPLKRSFITHEEILNGSILIFTMGDQPNKELWSNPEAAPYSMSRK